MLPLALLAIGIPALLVAMALLLARHREGPAMRWLRRHARAVALFTGVSYLLLSVLRFAELLDGDSLGAWASFLAGLAFIGAVVMGYPPSEREGPS